MRFIAGIILMLTLSGCGESAVDDEQETLASPESEPFDSESLDSRATASSTDCEGQARALAVGLCVNRAMHFFDGRGELNGTMEAEKLPSSCEPYHASTVMDGYEVATELISEHAGEQDVSEGDIHNSCAARLM